MIEAGAEGLSFELLNPNVYQPFKYVAASLIDERSKIGLQVKGRSPGPPATTRMRRKWAFPHSGRNEEVRRFDPRSGFSH